MPHRSIVAAIVLAWLFANGWLFYREVWPHWRSGDPPPYAIDLTEELGKSSVDWDIWSGSDRKEDKIGNATSEVERRPDHTYWLRTALKFKNLRLLDLQIKK